MIHFIVVDAYKFSESYIAYLKDKHIKCIHIQSTKRPIPAMQSSSTYNENDYVQSFIFDGDLDKLAQVCSQFQPIAVIPGTEPGVILADQLSERLNTKANDLSKTIARRDKFEMIKALQSENIPHIKSACVHHAIDAIQWIKKYSEFPVVIKPLASAGTEGVYFCQDELELQKKFVCIYGKENFLGIKNNGVLVQELLTGVEYMVNSVSVQGTHYFTDIWRSTKQCHEDFGSIYDREDLLQYSEPVVAQLSSYMLRVLNALGFRNGAAHAEIMMTKNGPILIEVGARVGGNVHCIAHSIALGANQLELAIDAYINERAFIKKTKYPYHVYKNLLTMLLATSQTGKIIDIPLLKKLHHCRSLFAYQINKKVGDQLEITRDLLTSPGKIILMHKNTSILEEDYQYIKGLMNDAFITEKEKS